MMETQDNQAGMAPQAEQCRQLLATAITIRIDQFKTMGGPTIAHALAITGYLDRATSTPLYPLPRPSGDESLTSRQTVEALAVLSFIPGGIYALGLYCKANATPPVVFYNADL